MRRKKAIVRASVIAACTMVSHIASATEGGGSSYPMGAENYLTGAMPPPGFYTVLFANRYTADTLKDNSGNDVPVNFKVTANVVVPRFIWVTNKVLFGGQVAHAVIVPIVNVDVNVAGASQNKTGLGDITVTALALGYHHSENLHSVVALDVITPTGSYKRNDIANTGRNYWAIEPVYTVSYVNPDGWNWDAKFMYDFNRKNPDTDYKSGQEFHFDYAVGYAVAKNWVAGVGGYAYKQITSDNQNGKTIPDNKGQAFALGPSLKYDNGKGFFITAKYQKEMNVRNRPEGNAFWVKASVPF